MAPYPYLSVTHAPDLSSRPISVKSMKAIKNAADKTNKEHAYLVEFCRLARHTANIFDISIEDAPPKKGNSKVSLLL